MKENEKETKKKAPDGGWGWFVCLGSSLITLSLRSLDPSFGLLFHDLLEDLKVDSTGTSFIMSILDSIVNFSGLFVGPLLKKFSYRKVALFGTLLSCSGLMLTSWADSMLHIICTYSILGGLGTGLALASSFVALNTFFDKKRGQAVGFSMAGTTLAMMLVPQLIRVLLEHFGFRGTMLIIGACALHSVVGACLLRPLQPEEKKIDKQVELKSLINNPNNLNGLKQNTKEEANGKSENTIEIKTSNSLMNKMKESFDLDLLRDQVYLNVATGAGLYYVAESNFKLMMPFFLSSIGMTKAEIAWCLSLTAFTDILARLILPTIFDKLGFKKRKIFWICSLIVGMGRSLLALQTKGISLIIVLVAIGFLRGATLVNLNLCISECCSLKKLPSAFGMFMVLKGIFVVTFSPLLGFVRDYTSSYTLCIHVMTILIISCFVMWGIEFSYKAVRSKKYSISDIENTKRPSEH